MSSGILYFFPVFRRRPKVIVENGVVLNSLFSKVVNDY